MSEIRNRVFIDTRVRISRKNRELKFIPEVLVLYTNVDWNFFQMVYKEDYREIINLYLKLFGKFIEWCPIKKTRSLYYDGVISLHKKDNLEVLKRIELKTLKGAKRVINNFKEKNENKFLN